MTKLGFTTSVKPDGTLHKSGVALTAPLLSAVISKVESKAWKAQLPFSKPRLEVKFQAYQAGVGVPAYIIPYEGGKARGVQLPAHGSDTLASALCFTATQNGCTVEVSGLPVSPFASHINVFDVSGPNAVAQLNAKVAKVNARIQKLQARFASADQARTGQPSAVGQNRRQFNFFPTTEHGVDEVNYWQGSNDIAQRKNNGYQFIGQTNYYDNIERRYAAPIGIDVSDPYEPFLGVYAALVGRRDPGGWSFYYQYYAKIKFRIVSILNDDPETEEIVTLSGRDSFPANVVLNHGAFWPHRTSNPW